MEDQSGQFGIARPVVGPNEIAGDATSTDRLVVQSPTVVTNLEHQQVRAAHRLECNRADRILAGCRPVVARLDAMTDRIADQMQQRLVQFLLQRPLQSRVFADQ